MKEYSRKPIKLAPSKVVYENGKNIPRWKEIFVFSARTAQEWTISLLVISIVLIASTAIGGYVYRIITLGDYRLEQIMVSVFRTQTPGAMVFESGFLSGVIFLFVKLKKTFDKHYEPPISGFVRTLAGIILVLWIDLVRLHLFPFRVLDNTGLIFTKTLTEILVAQFTTALLTVIFLPLSSNKAERIPISFTLTSFPSIYSLWNWFRYLAVVSAVSTFVVYVTTQSAPSNLLTSLPPEVFSFSIPWIEPSIIQLGVMFVTIAVAAIFYRPPSSRKMRPLVLIRLIVFLSSILACGYIFQNIPNIDGYVDALSIAFFISLSGIPVQRLLS